VVCYIVLRSIALFYFEVPSKLTLNLMTYSSHYANYYMKKMNKIYG